MAGPTMNPNNVMLADLGEHIKQMQDHSTNLQLASDTAATEVRGCIASNQELVDRLDNLERLIDYLATTDHTIGDRITAFRAKERVGL